MRVARVELKVRPFGGHLTVQSFTCANTAIEENLEPMIYLVISAFGIRALCSSDGIPSLKLGPLLQGS